MHRASSEPQFSVWFQGTGKIECRSWGKVLLNLRSHAWVRKQERKVSKHSLPGELVCLSVIDNYFKMCKCVNFKFWSEMLGKKKKKSRAFQSISVHSEADVRNSVRWKFCLWELVPFYKWHNENERRMKVLKTTNKNSRNLCPTSSQYLRLFSSHAIWYHFQTNSV